MSNEVKNFIRKIVFTVIAFAALCIFCFDMFGSTGSPPFGFLGPPLPLLAVREFFLPPPLSPNNTLPPFTHIPPLSKPAPPHGAHRFFPFSLDTGKTSRPRPVETRKHTPERRSVHECHRCGGLPDTKYACAVAP